MSDIPDANEKAASLFEELRSMCSIEGWDGYECIDWDKAGAIEAIRLALMEERAAERERCAKLAENSNYFPSEGDSIAASIRGQP